MTPGIEVSACRKITEEASSSKNHPSYTSIPVGELNSCEPRSKIERPLELAQKNKRARNDAGSIMQNDHISQLLDKKVLELEREIERELEQKKEQKTQQQCFKKWDVPCYPPGHSLWPQDNLPARQYLNKPDGSCGPGYASLAPVHGHHIYQPLWQQPPPLKQQLTYSLSLYLMRYPTHPSTIAVEPATIGIHSNFLPLTHLPMAHKQAMATTNANGSSFPLLWSCLLHLGSIHLLRSVIQHLVRTLVFQTEI